MIDIEALKAQLAESAAGWINEVDSRIQAKTAIEQLQAENAKLESELEEARKEIEGLKGYQRSLLERLNLMSRDDHYSSGRETHNMRG